MNNHFRPIQAFLWFLPALYLGFVLFAVVSIYAEPLSKPTRESTPVKDSATDLSSQNSGSKDTEKSGSTNSGFENVEKEELDILRTNVEKRSDDLQKLISQLTLGNAVYTALLGILAYFGLKEAKSDADRLVQNYKDALTEKIEQFEAIKKEFSDFKDEIRDDIPGLIEMQKGLRAVLSHVRMEVDMSLLWLGGEGAASYNSLSEEQRQKVILAEMAISSLDYFRLQAANKTVAAEIFDGLTDFYAARSRALNNDAADLSRALVHVDRACDIDPKNPMHFSRRGAITLTTYLNNPIRPKALLGNAQSDFDYALSLEPNHPSSLYCKAWIFDETGQFEKAIEMLTKMIDQGDNLPNGSRGRRLVNAYINRACARSKQFLQAVSPDRTIPRENLEKVQFILDDCTRAESEAIVFAQKARFEGDMRREWSEGGELAGLRFYLTDKQSALVGRFVGV